MTLRPAAALARAALVAALVAAPCGAHGRDPAAVRAKIVSEARRHLGQRFQGDCSGFVLSLLDAAGVRVALAPARSRSESLFNASGRVRRPRPGDLAFFHDTYDRDRDGRSNDPYTHVAVVERAKGDVVLLVHRGSRGIERVRMHLARRSDRAVNDPVRQRRRGDPAAMRVLSGELFAGFGVVVAR